MAWIDTWRAKLTTAEAAVATLQPGDHVFMGGNAATPRVLARALAARAASCPGVTVGHVLLLGDDPFAAEKAAGLIRHLSWFVGPADRAAVAEGRADYVPCHLSEIPGLLRAGRPRIDAALLMTSPPDKHGFLSLGVEVLASLAAAEVARRVIVQVNPAMPRVLGNAFLHVDDVHAIVEAEAPLPELVPRPASAVEQAIARHVATLVPEGATLQLGIGGIPDAVIAQLSDRTDLGVHSEMISDGVMAAVENGAVTGRRKTRHRRKVVTTFALGTRALYDWLHENAAVEAHPCDHTNDLLVASQNDRLVALNSAISVDLTGQVNADSIGGRIFSGVGGQLDFVRAAARSHGGVPIIALPSTAQGGTVSRIVPTLATGAGVVTPRADVRYVVTEHGVADLWGRSLRERAAALAAIADPAFRDALCAAVPGVRPEGV
ncbi:MAG: acetyl-CoA hydrolase/transferase family protein [Alphaproteobacteria bacterium]|nr:acetyl-CoA hydrolase/transferase family protein [Alphaproteobacteria bacterium]